MEKLRLKSKKIVSEKEGHEAVYGAEGEKYWFGRESIHQLLVPDVGDRQAHKLSPETIRIVNREAGEMLDFFGYEKL